MFHPPASRQSHAGQRSWPSKLCVFVTILVAAAFQTTLAVTPDFHPNAAGSHHLAFARVNESGERTFKTLVAEYQTRIRSHPRELGTRIELCEFLREVREEEGDLEDTADETLSRQVDELTVLFPDDRPALVFRASLLQADSSIRLLEGYLDRHKGTAVDSLAWDVFEQLAREYDRKGEPYKALHYGSEAMRINDTLDLTLLVAEQCEKAGDPKSALAYLQKFKDKDSSPWVCMQKGEILLRLGNSDDAITLFTRALAKEDWPGTLISLASSLEQAGRLNEARASIVKAGANSYYKEESARALFLFDLKHSPADSAIRSYGNLRDIGFETDPVARHRIALFLAHPSLPWRLRDIGGLLLLMLLIAVVALIPGLIVAPVHYAGLARKISPPENSRWTLKHLWLAGSLMVVGSLIALLIFDYRSITSQFRKYPESGGVLEKARMAGVVLTYMGLVALGCLAFVRKKDILSFWGARWSKLKSILSGLGWMFIVNAVFGVAMIIVYLLSHPEIFGKGEEVIRPLVSRRIEYLLAVKAVAGPALFVAIVALLAPLCEEFIFRAVALRSFQRYIPFGWANVVQALLFAFAHGELMAGIHAFMIGIVAGILRNRSSSLAPAIALHVSNNLVAAAVFLVMS